MFWKILKVIRISIEMAVFTVVFAVLILWVSYETGVLKKNFPTKHYFIDATEVTLSISLLYATFQEMHKDISFI